MERFLLFFLCVCLVVSAVAQGENRQHEVFDAVAEHCDFEYFERLGNLFRQSAELATPAVVSIRVTRNQSISRGTPARPVEGSGIIATIAQKQVILTNRHVVERAEPSSIEILTHDRRLLTITGILGNEDFDIAVIEVDEELPKSVQFGDSDQVRVGDIVLAVGNPFGLDRSVSKGIISAVGRRNVPGTSGSAPRVDFFQTDAAVWRYLEYHRPNPRRQTK